MNPIQLHLELAGRPTTIQLKPFDITSKSRTSFTLGRDDEHRIDLLHSDMSVTIWVSSVHVREKLYKSIKIGRQPQIQVGGDVVGMRLVRYENGWPKQTPRVVMSHRIKPEHGVESYKLEFNPCIKEGTAISVLKPSPLGKQQILGMPAHFPRQVHLAGDLVYVSNVYQAFVAVMGSNELASRLRSEIEANPGLIIHPNKEVRCLIVREKSTVRAYSLNNLPPADAEKARRLGLKIEQSPMSISTSMKEFAIKLGWLELAKHI